MILDLYEEVAEEIFVVKCCSTGLLNAIFFQEAGDFTGITAREGDKALPIFFK